MKAPFCVVVAKVGSPRLKFDFGEIRAQAWRNLEKWGRHVCYSFTATNTTNA